LIDRFYIEQRKNTYLKKMEAVLAYAGHHKCRSCMLLSYFHETDTHKCGVCDVCLQEKKQKNADHYHDLIVNNIIQLLNTAPLDLNQLVTAIKTGTKTERLHIIRQLMDAGQIKTNGDKYYL